MGSVKNAVRRKRTFHELTPFGHAQSGKEAMTEILFAIQKPLIAQGIYPYFQLFERLTAMQLTAMSRALWNATRTEY
jgi:hypothetical protein